MYIFVSLQKPEILYVFMKISHLNRHVFTVIFFSSPTSAVNDAYRLFVNGKPLEMPPTLTKRFRATHIPVDGGWNDLFFFWIYTSRSALPWNTSSPPQIARFPRSSLAEKRVSRRDSEINRSGIENASVGSDSRCLITRRRGTRHTRCGPFNWLPRGEANTASK